MNRQQPLALAPPAGDADWSNGACSIVAPAAPWHRSTWRSSTWRESWRRRGGSSRSGVAATGDRLADRSGSGDAPVRAASIRAVRPAVRRRQFLVGGSGGGGGVQDATGQPAADERIVAFTRAAITVIWHLAQTRASWPGWCSALRRRPSPRSRHASRRRRAAGASRRGFTDRPFRFAHAVLAPVRGLRGAARPGSVNSCGGSGCRSRARRARAGSRCNDATGGTSHEIIRA